MLFARVLKPGQTVEVSPKDGGEVLHLSQVCLVKPTDNNRTYLRVSAGGKDFATCVLQRDKVECASVDLFLATRGGVRLTADGKGELHLTGYFEPNEDDNSESEGEGEGVFADEDADSDEDADLDDSDDGTSTMNAPVVRGGKIEDLDAESSNEEDEEAKRKASKKLKQMVANVTDKKALMAKALSQNGEVLDGGAGGGSDGDAASEDDGSSSEEEEPTTKNATKQKPNDKRKAPQKQQQPNKKAKGHDGRSSTSSGFDSADATKYAEALVEFLKKRGKAPLASLGQMVKKPASVQGKLAAFLKSKPDIFAVEGGFCSLKQQ